MFTTMKLKHFFIILFFQAAAALYGQQLIIKDGPKIAERLFEVKLLSASGRDSLKAYLKNGAPSFGLNGCIIFGDERQKVLTFCALAFAAEEASRNGLLEVYERWEKNRAQQNLDTLYKYFREKELYKFSGYLIENQILTPELEGRYPDKTTEEIVNFGTYGQNFAGNNPVHQERSVAGKHRLKTLNDYLNLGLIDEDTYGEGLERIRSNEINSELKLTVFVWERIQFYKVFRPQKDAQIKDIIELRKLGLLSEWNTEELLASYKPLSLLTGQEIFSARSDVVVLDERNLPQKPAEAYAIIFQQLKTILPDFDYRNLKVRFEYVPADKIYRERPSLDAVISMKIKRKKYEHRYFYMTIPDQSSSKFQPDTFFLNTEYAHVVNRWLRDINSPSRLRVEGFSNTSHGLDLYTRSISTPFYTTYPSVVKDWHCGQAVFDPPPFNQIVLEESVSHFNKEDIRRFIKNCKKAGLFTHLSSRQINAAEKRVYKGMYVNYSSILSCFPGILFKSTDGTYQFEKTRVVWDLFNEVIGYGPSDLKQEVIGYESSELKQYGIGANQWFISFSMHGKSYNLTFNNFIRLKALMQEVLHDVNEDLAIYEIVNEPGIIILTKSQYEYLNRVEPGVFMRW